ncbi:hypothetical protein RJ641_012456 [Dillenia turbinata]|uniref:Uncharacterized protein n=1 Tax=Dillenia turbinata TaxID=194707 RepID=A0AAN8UZ83_9MAGN
MQTVSRSLYSWCIAYRAASPPRPHPFLVAFLLATPECQEWPMALISPPNEQRLMLLIGRSNSFDECCVMPKQRVIEFATVQKIVKAKVALLLVRHGADVDVEDKEGYTSSYGVQLLKPQELECLAAIGHRDRKLAAMVLYFLPNRALTFRFSTVTKSVSLLNSNLLQTLVFCSSSSSPLLIPPHKSVPLAASIAILLWSTSEENQKFAEFDKRFQTSPLLKELLKRSKMNKEKNRQAIQDKYCLPWAEWGVGDCSTEGMSADERDNFIAMLKQKAA